MQETIIKDVLDEIRAVLIKNEEVIIKYIYEKNINTARCQEDGCLLGQEEVLSAMQNAIRDAYRCGISDFRDYYNGK